MPDWASNALSHLFARLTPLEQWRYPVSPEIRRLVRWTLILTIVTTSAFPFLPAEVTVSGWAVWWLGRWIAGVMEYGARQWPLAVLLGSIAFLLESYLVIASNWLTSAPKRLQWLMVGSSLFIAHNVLVMGAIAGLWLLVMLLWVLFIALVLATGGVLIVLWLIIR